jgi:hypothetical protein
MPASSAPNPGRPQLKSFVATVALALALLLVMPAPLAGATHPIPDSLILDASKRVAGLTAGQLLGEEYRQLLELPEAINPLAGNGNTCMSAGRRDKVLILFTVPDDPDSNTDTPAECDIKPGTPVFFSTLVAECSSVEKPPFFGKTERQQRQCARDYLEENSAVHIYVTIDGEPAVDINMDRFLAVSGQQYVHLPETNILGVSKKRATFVAAGYTVLLRSLSPGTHTIAVEVVGSPYPGTNRAIVNVGWGHDR